jgi:hypothetical protein
MSMTPRQTTGLVPAQAQRADQLQQNEQTQRQRTAQKIHNQEVITSDPESLEAEAERQLANSAALRVDPPPFVEKDAREPPAGNDPDWAKREDEVENGTVRTASLAEDDPAPAEAGPGPRRPAFRVKRVNGKVTATVEPTLADRLRVRAGLSSASARARQFADRARKRLLTLHAIAVGLLERRQAAFFGAPDLRTACLLLVPVKDVADRLPVMPIAWDKSYKNRLGGLGVACAFGTLPLNLFWPQPASVRKAWEREAERRSLQGTDRKAWFVQVAEDGRLDDVPLPDELRAFLRTLAGPATGGQGAGARHAAKRPGSKAAKAPRKPR